MDDLPFGESLVIGIGIAFVMLIVNLLALRRTKQPMWEGVVNNKYSKEKRENRGGEDDNWEPIQNISQSSRLTLARKDHSGI